MASLPPALPRWLERAVQVNTTAYVTIPGRDKQYRTRIEDVGGRMVALAIPYDRGAPLWVSPGSTIGLMVMGPVCPLRMKVRIVRLVNKPLPMWVVELPPDDEIEAVQRRRAVRVPVLLDVEVRPQPSGSEGPDREQEELVLRGQVVDISATGARITVRGNLEVGDGVHLKVSFPWGSEAVEGRVVSRVPTREMRMGVRSGLTEPLFSYGVEFRDVRPRLEDQICRFVLERQSEMRARGLL